MPDSPINPILDSANAYLKHAISARNDKTLRERVVTSGIRLLTQLLDEVPKDIAAHDLAEVTLVYDVLSAQLAAVTGRQPDELFPALVELCDDADARPLLAQAPPPQPALVKQLRDLVLQIRVTYAWPRAARTTRTVHVQYRTGSKFKAATSRQPVSHDDLPERVRELMITTAERQVTFQLYPKPA